MSVQIENLEKNMAKLTIEVSAEAFDKAIQAAYLKQKTNISVPGFRKGKVPRHMIEKMYGVEIFYEDAANSLIPKEYSAAAAESNLDIVSQPEIDVVQVEKGKAFIFTAEVAVKPEVKLGKYKGVTVTKVETEVTDEELMAEIDKERENNSRTITIEDRSVQDKDTVLIDFEGFVDGEAFEGGKGENHSLVIGSHSFIDTFEDQVIGKNIGDAFDVNVTFPEEYHVPELAGKPAVFNVKVNEIKAKELPELDDEFAQDISEFDTLEAYKADVLLKITDRKAAQAKRELEDEVIKKIIEDSVMEIPEPMIQSQVNSMLDEFAGRMKQQGITFEQYMQFTGMTQEKLKEQMQPEALNRLQSSLVLEAIAKEENFEITDEAVEEEMKKMAEMYGMEFEKVKDLLGDAEKENIKKDLAIQEAVKLISENAQAK